MPRPSSRDKILDALASIIVNEGMAAATLDAVCARAGVSKGGLLYHFPSREAMFDGLQQRLLGSVDAAVAEAPTDPHALIEWYLSEPVIDDTESGIYAALIATARADATGDVAAARLAELFDRYFVPLRTLADPALAAHVEMVADGMFLRAILGLTIPGPAARAAMIERLTRPDVADPT